MARAEGLKTCSPRNLMMYFWPMAMNAPSQRKPNPFMENQSPQRVPLVLTNQVRELAACMALLGNWMTFCVSAKREISEMAATKIVEMISAGVEISLFAETQKVIQFPSRPAP